MHGAAVHYQLQLSWTCGSLSGLCTTPKCSLGCSSPPPCHASTPSRPHISGSRSRTSVPSLTRDRSPTTWSWSLWHFGQSKVHATIFTINVGRREAILINSDSSEDYTAAYWEPTENTDENRSGRQFTDCLWDCREGPQPYPPGAEPWGHGVLSVTFLGWMSLSASLQFP